MLQGFVPFPAEFAQRYREKGYWRDQSLAQEFAAVFERFATAHGVDRRRSAVHLCRTRYRSATTSR